MGSITYDPAGLAPWWTRYVRGQDILGSSRGHVRRRFDELPNNGGAPTCCSSRGLEQLSHRVVS